MCRITLLTSSLEWVWPPELQLTHLSLITLICSLYTWLSLLFLALHCSGCLTYLCMYCMLWKSPFSTDLILGHVNECLWILLDLFCGRDWTSPMSEILYYSVLFCWKIFRTFLLSLFLKKNKKKTHQAYVYGKIISWRDGDRVGLFYVLLDVSGLHFSHTLAMFSISPSSCKHFCELVVATATASLTEKTEIFFFRLTPECTTSCRRISILFIMLTSKMPCWVCWQQARQVILVILVPTKPPTSFSGMS